MTVSDQNSTFQHLNIVSSTHSGAYILQSTNGSDLIGWATELARAYNCTGEQDNTCRNCKMILAGTFPDISIITPGDKPSIGIIQVREATAKLAFSVARGTKMRVMLIHPAHKLTVEAQNALLKTIEEPPPSTIILLGTDQASSLIETVRSRSQLIILAQGSNAAKENTQLESAVSNMLSENVFMGLIAAKNAASAKLDVQELTAALQARLILAQSVDSDPHRLNRQLASLERCRTYLAAGVSPRAALELAVLDMA